MSCKGLTYSGEGEGGEVSARPHRIRCHWGQKGRWATTHSSDVTDLPKYFDNGISLLLRVLTHKSLPMIRQMYIASPRVILFYALMLLVLG